MAEFKREIIKNEFSRFCDDDGTISMAEFGLLMVGNASDRFLMGYLKSMQDSQKRCPDQWSERISFQDYYHFHRTMTNFCSDLKEAMRLFANNSDSQKFNTNDLQRAAQIVSGQELKDACVFVLMEIFDLNDDGTMSWYDFHTAMRHRRAMITHSVTKMSKVKMNAFERFLRCMQKSKD
jgi:Ca2+-binding EF-hand superfamily protein